MPDNRSVCAKCGIINDDGKCECNDFGNKDFEANDICPTCGLDNVMEDCDCYIKSKEDIVKDTNPKDAVGTKKVPFGVLPAPVLGETALALLEGARKYGRHNWRVAGVRASVYYDAVVMRHLAPFWEGEDIDPDSGLSHITKAIAGLMVLRDSMIQGNWVDDRPPKSPDGWKDELNKKAKNIIEKYPDALAPYTELNKDNKNA